MTQKELVAALQKRISELEEANKKLSAELIYYKEKDAARSDKDSENAQTSKISNDSEKDQGSRIIKRDISEEMAKRFFSSFGGECIFLSKEIIVPVKWKSAFRDTEISH